MAADKPWSLCSICSLSRVAGISWEESKGVLERPRSLALSPVTSREVADKESKG